MKNNIYSTFDLSKSLSPGRTHLNIEEVVRRNGHSGTCELKKGVRGDRGLSGGKKLDLDGKVIVKVESSLKKA